MKMKEVQTLASTASLPRRSKDVRVDRNGVTCYDEEITNIVNYTYDFEITSPQAWTRATSALLDAIGAGFESITTSAELSQLIGPNFPSPDTIPNGFKLPGTKYQLDMVKGAFDMGAMIRYLNHNDVFLGAEWTHPSGMRNTPYYFTETPANTLSLVQTISEPYYRQPMSSRV